MFITPHHCAPVIFSCEWDMVRNTSDDASVIIPELKSGLRTGWQVWDVWHRGAAGSTALSGMPAEANGCTHIQLSMTAAVFLSVPTYTLACQNGRKVHLFFIDSASMHPHLGQRSLPLCVLKVNCTAVMGIGRQSGTNWHEWAWLQALCGWRRDRRLLSMCPCRRIMCSTFSKAHRQKCQTGSGAGWARRLAQFIKGLRCTTQNTSRSPWDRHIVHNGAIHNSAVI